MFDVDASYIAKMNAVPRDGTFIGGAAEVYVVVGGAPIYVSNWTYVGGAPSSIVKVDGNAIANAGAPSDRYSHFNAVPADGAYLQSPLPPSTLPPSPWPPPDPTALLLAGVAAASSPKTRTAKKLLELSARQRGDRAANPR